MTAVTAAEVFDVVRDAIHLVLDRDPATIARETLLVDDLHADSLALAEIAEIVERRLARVVDGYQIIDADLDDIATVGEAVDYAVSRL